MDFQYDPDARCATTVLSSPHATECPVQYASAFPAPDARPAHCQWHSHQGFSREAPSGRKSEAHASGVMRAVLLLNVFLNDFKWRTAHATGEVRRRPKCVSLPGGLMQIGMLQFHLATANPFQAVNQLADRHLRREVKQHVNVIRLPNKLHQLAFK